MGLYVYCVGRMDHPQPRDVAGVDEAAVHTYEAGEFTVWASELNAAPRPSLDRVRVHNTVVEAACAVATPLPFRFGQWFDTYDALVASIGQRKDELDEGLRRVAGALEHGVRVIDPQLRADPPDRASGTAYLESLARRARDDHLMRSRGRDVAAALRDWLGPLVRDERVHHAGGGALAAIAYLVDRHDTGSYDSRVRTFPPEQPELQFLFTGPWPPYGFVE